MSDPESVLRQSCEDEVRANIAEFRTKYPHVLSPEIQERVDRIDAILLDIARTTDKLVSGATGETES